MTEPLLRFSAALHAVASTRDVQQLPQQIVEQAMHLLDATSGALWLHAGDTLACAASLPAGEPGQPPPLVKHAQMKKGTLLAPLRTAECDLGVLALRGLSASDDLGSDINSTVSLLEHFAQHAALALQEAQSREKLAAFAGTLAHEVKSPLGYTVFSLDELVERFTELPLRDIHATLIEVLAASHEIARLADSLLEWATLPAASVATLESVDVHAALETALARLSPLMRARQPKLTFVGLMAEEEAVLVQGRRGWVEAVWMNLIGNAIKHGAGEQDLDIEIGAARDGARLRGWVRDGGQGIALADQARLFQSLERLTAAPNGHGLGLSITQQLLKAMDGTVGVESEIGQGSTFYFTLPAETE